MPTKTSSAAIKGRVSHYSMGRARCPNMAVPPKSGLPDLSESVSHR
jgi:hypothetical protein